MFRRIAHLFGFKEKDEALSQRFAKMRQLYSEPGSEASIDALALKRTGLNMRAVVGAEKASGELYRKQLLDSYARSVEMEKEPVASK
jgi:hypothetical protein